MTFGGKGNGPEAVGGVAESLDDDAAVFDDAYIVFIEDGDAFVVTELADGDEGPGVEPFQDVAGGGVR